MSTSDNNSNNNAENEAPLLSSSIITATSSTSTTCPKDVQEVFIIPQHEDDTETKDFYFKNGLRYVKPYYFDYRTHAKGRWVGMPALQMYLKEFSYYTDEYVRRAIELGRITINGQKISPDRKIRHNELLCHRLHRHELPILNAPIKVIPCDNEGIIVIDKPPSLPVHPCGRYRKNSLTYLLQNEKLSYHERFVAATADVAVVNDLSNQAKNSSSNVVATTKASTDDSASRNSETNDEDRAVDLYPIHRLDRITSGILIISKTKEYSQQLTAQMTRNEIKKVYIAIVSGKWTRHDDKRTTKLDETNEQQQNNMETTVSDDNNNAVYECNTKIWAKDRRCGIWEASDEMGKYAAKTCFSLVAYDPVHDLSLLLCRPITGRTHQIRVHLQSLGHPIANDPCYGVDAERVRADRKRKIEETRKNSAAKRQKKTGEEEGVTSATTDTSDDSIPTVETVDFESITVETGNANIRDNKKRKERVQKEYEQRAAKEVQKVAKTNDHASPTSTSKAASSSSTETSEQLPPTFDPMCRECLEESIHPVEPHELYLYLHSWVYINPGVWNVKSELPFWLKNTFPDVSLEQMNSCLQHLLDSTAHLNKESVFTEEE